MNKIYIAAAALLIVFIIIIEELYLSWFYLLLATLYIVMALIITYEFGQVAKMKGYNEEKYLWYTFLFTTLGCLLVIALPDRGEKYNEVIVRKEEALFDDIPEL